MRAAAPTSLSFVLLAVAGCGSAQPTMSVVRAEVGDTSRVDEALQSFPTRDRINALVAAQSTRPASPDFGPPVARWEMARASLEGAPGAFEPIAQRLADANPGVTLSQAARCAATEVARFATEHQTLPGPYLSDYLIARCGASARGASVAVRSFSVRGMDESRLATRAADEIFNDWSPNVQGHRGRLGMASARHGSVIALGLVFLQDQPMSFPLEGAPMPIEGRITFQGTFHGVAEDVVALISHGESGVEPCITTREGTALHLNCPFDAGDESEFIEVISREPGRIIPHTGATLIAVRDPSAALVYEEPSVPAADALTDPRAQIVAALNAHRARLGRGPLTLEVAQSDANVPASTAFFSSADPQVQETAVLYAMAGWEVGGTVVGGNALAFELPPNLSPTSWTSYVLRHPFERHALLGASVTHVAIGFDPSPSVSHAMVSTYELFGDASPETERERVIAAIQSARALRGVRAATPVAIPAPFDRWAAQVTAGTVRPGEAARHATDETGPMPAGTNMMVLGVHELDHFPVPEELIRAGTVSVAVAHYRAPGAAWGQYTVFVVLGAPTSN